MIDIKRKNNESKDGDFLLLNNMLMLAFDEVMRV